MLKTIVGFIKLIGSVLATKKNLKIAQKYDKEGKITERDKIIKVSEEQWVQAVFKLTGSTIEVTGAENVPQDTAVAFIGNHQGYMDIPVIFGYINKMTAFIAKIEISKIPIVFPWMKLMQCTFINRKDRRQSIQAMAEAVENLKGGYSQVIFPEGTRSKGGPIKEFKSGSFKLAFRAGVPIVPITIDGTWRVLEEHMRLRSAHIILTIHPPIPTAGITKEEQQAMPALVQKIVESALPVEHLKGAK